MILVSRSGRNPSVYIPNVQPPHQPLSSYFLALDILRARDERVAAEERNRKFLDSHPEYQHLCACRHHQFAHYDGTGPCFAKRCGCQAFRDIGTAG